MLDVTQIKMDHDCPPHFVADFGTLIPPDKDIVQTWLNDTVLGVFDQYLMSKRPDENNDPEVGPVHNGVCILGPLFVSQVYEGWKRGNFNNDLRVLQATCNFATVKRLVFPANVGMDKDSDKYVSRTTRCAAHTLWESTFALKQTPFTVTTGWNSHIHATRTCSNLCEASSM